jgi:lipopolysaccharide/colanic/teichoic acid biosynthesis glycosyltransferase
MSIGGWKRFRLGIKRLVDILISAALLVVLSPVYVMVYLLIRLRLGTPVLFQQQRPGLNGEIFTVQKFRTMMVSDCVDGRRLTDAERIGRLGTFLRKTSLDELPQLLNVLRGDMSLVGPRPLLIEYLDKYTSEQARRHEMRPGITGWAQVNGRNYTKFSERFRLDVWYVDNWSLMLDARILWRTVLNVVRGSGVVTGQSVEDFDDVGFLKRDN